MTQTAVVMLKGGIGVAEKKQKKTAQPKPGLSTTEAAEILGVAQETVRRWVDKGVIKGFRWNPDNARSQRRLNANDVERKRVQLEEIRKNLDAA